jgi:hypothetical protein
LGDGCWMIRTEILVVLSSFNGVGVLLVDMVGCMISVDLEYESVIS